MAEPSLGQVVSAHSQGLTQLCRLLALPKELRLLIYEAYFGPMRRYRIAWEDRACWWTHPGPTGGTAHGTSLLLASRQIHEEALAVMLDRTVVDVYLGCDPQPAPKNAYLLNTADATKFLQYVQNVVIVIEIEIGPRTGDPDPSMDDLHAVLDAMNYGANTKRLTFDLVFTSWTAQQVEEFVIPDDEEFRSAISNLQCADGVVHIRRFNPLGMEL
ncbi:hypothetical protein LTR56_010324 [Elasticomyces elasticus]|nr:hypothetical protein LTR56_010324 [Elasticomyces elasticus]KAK3656892.1 hypothetical protein LTR22_009554 [Elasticomyces elasticus]KAK4926106.1 hypothetical protein LTR49_007021 [Elasticomyces elasticus]KAK5766123.1 hypothetical protein LTS12_003606 [Elasticomyces elasticus]